MKFCPKCNTKLRTTEKYCPKCEPHEKPKYETFGDQLIFAHYDGECKECRGRVKRGEKIFWDPYSKGVTHRECRRISKEEFDKMKKDLE